MSQRIVVTGGAGSIGRSVVRQLAGRGDQVIALVRDPGRALSLAALERGILDTYGVHS